MQVVTLIAGNAVCRNSCTARTPLFTGVCAIVVRQQVSHFRVGRGATKADCALNNPCWSQSALNAVAWTGVALVFVQIVFILASENLEWNRWLIQTLNIPQGITFPTYQLKVLPTFGCNCIRGASHGVGTARSWYPWRYVKSWSCGQTSRSRRTGKAVGLSTCNARVVHQSPPMGTFCNSSSKVGSALCSIIFAVIGSSWIASSKKSIHTTHSGSRLVAGGTQCIADKTTAVFEIGTRETRRASGQGRALLAWQHTRKADGVGAREINRVVGVAPGAGLRSWAGLAIDINAVLNLDS